MKHLMLMVFLANLPSYAELTVSKIDRMVEKIQGKRQSKEKIEFEKVYSPFATVVKEDENATPVVKTVEQQVTFQLSAIMNDRARINGRWLQVGDVIQGYTVTKIEPDRVVMKKTNREVELFLPDPDKMKLLQLSEG